jgi:hypothetical protein
MKIAINRCFGGFSLSEAVFDELGIKWKGYGYISNETLGVESDNSDAYRADPRLIAAIEKVGVKKSSGNVAEIAIIEVPDGACWEIDDYDGVETVHECHRTWS